MAAESINTMFRREVGTLDLDEISDKLLEETLLPRALQYFNALCRQTLSISDYTAGTVGSVIINDSEVGELIDQCLTLIACYYAWQYHKRHATVRATQQFFEYQTYLYDAYELIAALYPGVVMWEKNHYVVDPKAHSSEKAYMGLIVGNSTTEGGYMEIASSDELDSGDL